MQKRTFIFIFAILLLFLVMENSFITNIKYFLKFKILLFRHYKDKDNIPLYKFKCYLHCANAVYVGQFLLRRNNFLFSFI